jgi:hypothetical protein
MVAILDLAVFAGLYLLLAGVASTDEIVAAGTCALLATAFSILLRRGAARQFRFRSVPWHRVLARPLAALLPDTVRVARMLARAVVLGPRQGAGAWTWQEFRHGGDGADDAARRALVTLGVSFAPNAYVLQLPDTRDALLLHRLAERTPSPDPEWPL